MRCPFCAQFTPDAWTQLGYIPGTGRDFTGLSANWMRCANDQCQQAVVVVTETHTGPVIIEGQPTASIETSEKQWMVRPLGVVRIIDSLVPNPFRNDYLEAASILEQSPRMSAVLARRVLADVLENYGGHAQRDLVDRIDSFTKDPSVPSGLRENLHHFREAGNFGAHTMTNAARAAPGAQVEILDIGREEAEWTLDLLDRLFDHYIIGPERDKKIREAMNDRIKQAGRKELS
jgi:hypothetical protein